MEHQYSYQIHNIGRLQEEIACAYLTKQGLELVERNYRCKSGEIDLIMRENSTYVFVEVRYRTLSDHGDGLESITTKKRYKIIRAAKTYLQENNIYDTYPCRFDVVALNSDQKQQIYWIKDAFWIK